MPILTSILSLNPEIEKYDYVISAKNKIEHPFYSGELLDLKDNYLYINSPQSKLDSLKKHLDFFINNSDSELKISTEVYNSAYFIVSNLYPTIYNEIEIENVYSSKYGTLILDWEKCNGDVFSLEIGSKTLGYFIEIDNIDEKQIQEIDIENSLELLLIDLSAFLNS